ncbi:Na+/H+ antiporter subunit C [Marinobacter sp.]|uniref:Na+/H+ antiporter subunit C n=1 Tax=Marinobacter sp. TaxID=50741 RepID=UPI002B484341|nr:Na+/H+ antiporter subunit C [Marinobacter sp.]HKK57227.1 Na+/H+ antiporter subunit C [Marinobacter sp.]
MELVIAISLGVLTSTGVYLILRARTFSVVLGLTLLSHGVNLFLFTMGRLTTGAPPLIGLTESHTDPLPQALVLTAIVISFAMTAFVVVLALKAAVELRSDHVDGEDPNEDRQ